MPQSRVVDRRRFLKASVAAAGAVGLAPAIIGRRAAAQEKVLFVNTWGGSWTEAEDVAFYKPFTEQTGIRIRTVAPVSFAKLKAQVQSGNYEWDCSNAGMVEYEQAMHEGLLEPVDLSA